jgi:hypothetical protein
MGGISMKELVMAAVMAFFALTAQSQVTTGTISGTVRDSSGAVLPGATIVVANEDTGAVRTVPTDSAGHYLASSLNPGQYKITASLEGFQALVRSGVDLTVGRQAIINLDLQVGVITQSVEVTGEAPLVATVGGGLGNTIDSSSIAELPLNGRDLAQLVTLQAGVVNYTAGDPEPGGGKLLVVSGARPTTNVFYMDGIAIESYNKKTPTGMSGNFLGADGVREFKVDSNAYSAEFGGGAGGVFNITTKSGTNRFHGTGFWALRNDNFDAAQWEDNAFGDEEPEFKRNQFGASLGGPIRRDKTFFFGNLEGLRERQGETTIARTFSDTLRLGIIPPATTPVPIDSRIVPYLVFWPRPNGTSHADGTADYVTSKTVPIDENYYQGRVDHQFSQNNLGYLRYTYLNSEQYTPSTLPGESGFLDSQANHLVTLEDKYIFSPALLDSIRVGFSRTQPFNGLVDPRIVDPALSFNPKLLFLGALNPGSGLTGIGVSEATSDRHINSYQLANDFVYNKGRNTFKLGVAWSRNGFNVYFPSQPAGNYTFGNVSNFFRAIPNTFRGAIVDGYDDAYRTLKWNQIAIYFQDELRLTERVTISSGLRYEFATVPVEKWGRVANFRGDLDFLLSAGLSDITLGNPWLENPTLKNFAPRLGIGWDIFGDGRTVLRTGFGIFFVQFDQSWFRTMLWRMPPFLVDLQASSNVPFPNIYQLCGKDNPFNPSNPICSGRPAPQFPPYKTRSPYMMQYNLVIQRQIGKDSLISLGYSGSRGVRLNALANVNVPYGQDVNGRLVFAATSRPNPNFDNMLFRGPMADSFYNSLQASMIKKMAKGFQFSASYTFSKTIDDISGNAGGSDSDVTEVNSFYQDKSLFRGLSAYDARNVFSFSGVYEMPFGAGRRFGNSLGGFANKLVGGWELASILTLRDGFPASVSISNRLSAIGIQNERPDLMPDARANPTNGVSAGCYISTVGAVYSSTPPLGVTVGQVVEPGTKLGTAELYFDPCSFAIPPSRTFGNLGRNTIILPGFAGVDITMTKNTSLTEAMNLQFRFEAFNLLNRVNLGSPSRNVFDTAGRPSSIAGRITSSQTARQLQLSVKFIF